MIQLCFIDHQCGYLYKDFHPLRCRLQGEKVPLRREEVLIHGEGVRTDGRVCTVFWALSNCHRQIESNSNIYHIATYT
jgi:hypothetical protein